MARRASTELLEEGKAYGALRHVVTPLVTLIVVSASYKVVLLVLKPFLNKSWQATYDWLFVVGIVATAIWLAVAWFRHSESLMTAMETAADRPAKPVA